MIQSGLTLYHMFMNNITYSPFRFCRPKIFDDISADGSFVHQVFWPIAMPNIFWQWHETSGSKILVSFNGNTDIIGSLLHHQLRVTLCRLRGDGCPGLYQPEPVQSEEEKWAFHLEECWIDQFTSDPVGRSKHFLSIRHISRWTRPVSNTMLSFQGIPSSYQYN